MDPMANTSLWSLKSWELTSLRSLRDMIIREFHYLLLGNLQDNVWLVLITCIECAKSYILTSNPKMWSFVSEKMRSRRSQRLVNLPPPRFSRASMLIWSRNLAWKLLALYQNSRKNSNPLKLKRPQAPLSPHLNRVNLKIKRNTKFQMDLPASKERTLRRSCKRKRRSWRKDNRKMSRAFQPQQKPNLRRKSPSKKQPNKSSSLLTVSNRLDEVPRSMRMLWSKSVIWVMVAGLTITSPQRSRLDNIVHQRS